MVTTPDETGVVVLDSTRAALTGLTLPSPPPARIYISGHLYRIAAPQVALPPIINVIKTIVNWTGPAARIARNILHILIAGGTGSTSDPIFLQNVANEVMTAFGAAAIGGAVSSAWTLESVTCRDLGGTSTASTSTSTALVGGVTGGSLPPQSATVISWIIAPSYRGGKPRTYLPGVPFSAITPAGSSTLDPTFCGNARTSAETFRGHIGSHPVSGSTLTLGSVSYFHGHTVRPTPIFNEYLGSKVHERVDSQRRRSGAESGFGVVP